MPDPSGVGLQGAQSNIFAAHACSFAWNARVHYDVYVVRPSISKGEHTMNKDRVQGSVEQAKGKIKEVAGTATGDTKLETEGKAQKTAGKLQNTIGGMKDAVKEAIDD